mgnify:CR=1 FL=1
MQAQTINNFWVAYNADMRTGRPTKTPRTTFGARLCALREAAGLSQQEVADRLQITQPSYAYWERHEVALKPDQLTKLAAVLKVSVERLLEEPKSNNSRGGPVGKARRVFEEVSSLPRHQQQRIIGVVEDLLSVQRANGHKQAA